jgi:hypothetical protein
MQDMTASVLGTIQFNHSFMSIIIVTNNLNVLVQANKLAPDADVSNVFSCLEAYLLLLLGLCLPYAWAIAAANHITLVSRGSAVLAATY